MELVPLLTLAEVSQFLKVKSETICVLIKKEGLPASKVGGQWRFDADEVKGWFKQQRPSNQGKPIA